MAALNEACTGPMVTVGLSALAGLAVGAWLVRLGVLVDVLIACLCDEEPHAAAVRAASTTAITVPPLGVMPPAQEMLPPGPSGWRDRFACMSPWRSCNSGP